MPAGYNPAMPLPGPGRSFALILLLPAALRAQAPSVRVLSTGVLAERRLTESSGVVASRRHPGIYWTINDSGNGPGLFATDSSGRAVAALLVRGAANVDWEDLATGPCADGSPCLYIGDIGDNRARRSRLVVYRLAEPDIGGPSSTAPVLDSLVLRYPDRPHDAEALAVTRDGWLLVITKDTSGPPRLYRAALAGEGAERRLERVGDLPVATSVLRGRLVTGADISPDGRWLALRTYVSIHLFRVGEGGRLTPRTDPNGLLIPAVETQGEAIAFDGNDVLVLTSERGYAGRPTIIRLRLDLPAEP